MRRIAIIASLVCSVGFIPAVSGASYKGDVRASAKLVRKKVDRKFGKRVGGRNIAARGVVAHGKRRDATLHELHSYRATLLRTLAPPAIARPVPSPETGVPSLVGGSPAGGAGLPACASESGTNYSTGPENTNPSSATGRYQILQSTHAALCSDLGWSPGDQDACAARIYDKQGAGAWVGCG